MKKGKKGGRRRRLIFRLTNEMGGGKGGKFRSLMELKYRRYIRFIEIIT